MAAGNELRAEAQRSLAFGATGANYVAIGTPMAHPINIFIVQNLTDATMQFSFDGTIDHFVLPANGMWVSDNVTNRQETNTAFFLGKGTSFYVKRIGTPTTGSLYVTVLYARGA